MKKIGTIPVALVLLCILPVLCLFGGCGAFGLDGGPTPGEARAAAVATHAQLEAAGKADDAEKAKAVIKAIDDATAPDGTWKPGAATTAAAGWLASKGPWWAAIALSLAGNVFQWVRPRKVTT